MILLLFLLSNKFYANERLINYTNAVLIVKVNNLGKNEIKCSVFIIKISRHGVESSCFVIDSLAANGLLPRSRSTGLLLKSHGIHYFF